MKKLHIIIALVLWGCAASQGSTEYVSELCFPKWELLIFCCKADSNHLTGTWSYMVMTKTTNDCPTQLYMDDDTVSLNLGEVYCRRPS